MELVTSHSYLFLAQSEDFRNQNGYPSRKTKNKITTRILRRPKVEQTTGLSRSSIYAKMDPKSVYHDLSFPQSVKLGLRAVGWEESAIYAWLDSRESRIA